MGCLRRTSTIGTKESCARLSRLACLSRSQESEGFFPAGYIVPRRAGDDGDLWRNSGQYYLAVPDSTRTAFIFNLTSTTVYTEHLGTTSFGEYQTWNSTNYGLIFGGGFEFSLGNGRPTGDTELYSPTGRHSCRARASPVPIRRVVNNTSLSSTSGVWKSSQSRTLPECRSRAALRWLGVGC